MPTQRARSREFWPRRRILHADDKAITYFILNLNINFFFFFLQSCGEANHLGFLFEI